MTERLTKAAIVFLLAAGVAACDRVPLLAPTNSTITLSAGAKVLPVNGTTGLTAFVTESSGTPVQNGTSVRFMTTLGTVQPVEAQTANGIAVATFVAGTSSGVADVRAISGGTVGAAAGAAAANSVQITVGAAAVTTVTLRANPSGVGPNGGAVELVATVLSTDGNGLPGISVTFGTDQGVLSVQTVPTDASGEARSVLTTTQKASVTATAGTKTSTAVVVDVRPGPGVTITCTNCTPPFQANASTNTATATFTVAKGTGSSSLRDTTIDFGDGISQGLGTLAGGSVTVSHAYDGPSGFSPKTYTATIRATDVNNETATASASVTVTPRSALTVNLSVGQITSTPAGQPVVGTFTATVTGGDAQTPGTYQWDFGDGKTATTTALTSVAATTTHVFEASSRVRPATGTVTVTTADGRTATGRTEFIVP